MSAVNPPAPSPSITEPLSLESITETISRSPSPSRSAAAIEIAPRPPSGRGKKSFDIETCGFETDHELSAKLIRAGITIREVPIVYTPRSVGEGKKIRPIDGLVAIKTLIKYRFL